MSRRAENNQQKERKKITCKEIRKIIADDPALTMAFGNVEAPSWDRYVEEICKKARIPKLII